MKKILLSLFIIFCLCGCVHTDDNAVMEAEQYTSGLHDNIYKPDKRSDGESFGVAIVDDAPSRSSGALLYYAVRKMKNDGWLNIDEELPFDPENVYVRDIVGYLSQKNTGGYVEFPNEACIYLNEDTRQSCEKKLDDLINEKKIDIIVCPGADSALFAQNISRGRVPVLSGFGSEPEASDTTVSENLYDEKNFSVHINCSDCKGQLTFYKNICDFKNLGMVYYDEASADIDRYAAAAKSLGITLSSLKMDESVSSAEDTDIYYAEYINSALKLADENGIDAFMINSGMVPDEKMAEKICSILYIRCIPVFSQTGDEFLQKGSPLASVVFSPRDKAEFLVNTAAGILSGKKREDIPQSYNAPLHIIINKGAANKLGISIDYSILKYADKVYY